MWIFPTHCSGRTTDPTLRQHNHSRAVGTVLVAAASVLLASAAFAQITLPTVPVPATPQARLIEWDLPADLDASPGAMVVDTQGDDKSRIWFVTRVGGPTKVYRLDFPKSLMKANARWTSYDLSLNAIVTGGLRKIRPSRDRDRRFIFVRTGATLERVDTKNCTTTPRQCDLTVWLDQPDGLDDPFINVSDVAVDDRNNVFTTHSPFNDPKLSYVQRLTPATSQSPLTVTRWLVPGGGAGLCTVSITEPCIAGIDVSPMNRNLVYFSEERFAGSGAITELDTFYNKVRRWSFADVTAKCGVGCSVFGPRQLNIGRSGKIWVVTGSGHLVSLDPRSNKVTVHQMPNDDGADPFGVAPDDDVIGYTNSLADRVGMLIPRGNTITVLPMGPTPVTQAPADVDTTPGDAAVDSNFVRPEPKTVEGRVTPKDDGIFVEALIKNPNDSFHPLGISPAKGKAQGSFFYAVGANGRLDPITGAALTNRVGFVRLRVCEKQKFPRDDDDRDDGWEGADNWHDSHRHGDCHDFDDDGIDDGQDSPTGREQVQRNDATALPAGGSVDHTLTASPTTLALIAVAEADNPLAQIGIDIYNAAGILVARSIPAPTVAVAQVVLPAAGTYTCRVRNYSAVATNYTPTLIVREPQVLNDIDPLP